MAEERLIDTDKDKKYRFRINEDGEEELIIDDSETEETVEEAEFEVPDFEEDDEEAAALTPEQLAERQRRAERERDERERRLAASIASAAEDCRIGNFSTALDALAIAEEIEPGNGRVHALKFLAYTRNCTEWEENTAKAWEAAEDVKEYTDKEYRRELLAAAQEGGLEKKTQEIESRVRALSEENDRKKAERAVRFNADYKKAAIFLACTGIPFLAFLAVAIYFSTVMYATTDGLNIILTIVFGALALATLIACLFAVRAFSTASRRVRLNKRDTSTELGRKYIAENGKLVGLKGIYAALKD